MSDLQISVESMKRVELVTVSGRIDSSSAPQLDETLKGLMENGRYKMVIELSGVNYMSSAALRVLVSAVRECKSHRGNVKLANVSDRVNEVLKLAGLDAIFEVFDDKTAAVGSF
ncbi:MAG: STAS domain-containing protein [Ardenticatenaceae bacterium]|nr:STAS domain-containing protein [Ardenticatenaceae bacterium]